LATETSDILTTISVIIAIVVAWFSFFQYKKDQMIRRKDTLLPLISEFDDEAKNMKLAKELLDGFKYTVGLTWKFVTVEYSNYTINEKHIFRLHDDSRELITDEGEIEIRRSFDALLDFFGKLGYLLEIGLLKDKEIAYFRYYIEKAKDSESIGLYLSNYDFKLYLDLLAKLHYEQRGYVKKSQIVQTS
jgi:hypothetical protein